MSMKDGDDSQWSLNSCDESDLEEYEARLYSMVYHNSSTYDEATSDQCPDADSNKTNIAESVPNGVINVESPKPTSSIQDECHYSSRTKASRLDGVNEIIDIADNNQHGGDKGLAARNRHDARTQRNKNMCSKKQSNSADIPKTASLYFQNLKKSLNNVQYLQSVETRLPKQSDLSNARSSSAPLLPADRSALANFTFAEICNKSPGVAPVFRLDDRLFPGAPRNTSKEECELSHRLFSNRPAERDRHNHLFNQLPTVPIPSAPVTPKRDSHKARRKKLRDALREKRRAHKVAASLQAAFPATFARLEQIPDPDDDPVEVFPNPRPVETVVNLVDEVINLDSDSADSIVVLTPPSRTPPPVVALSDDEGGGEQPPPSPPPPPPPLHPVLETEHVENSLDFLDSWADEPDVLSRSQVTVFAHLMSNGGPKESPLDDGLFRRVVEDVRARLSGEEGATLILNVGDDSCQDQTDEPRPAPGGKRKRDQSEHSPRKKRGKRAREKSRQQLQDFLQTRSGMTSLLYTKVEGQYALPADQVRPRYPPKWTRHMRHFYSDSWGGEDFDVQAMQRSMSGDQSLWRISWEDRRGPVPLQGPYRRLRCYNCSRFGHPVTMCPEVPRVTKCHMCGEPGHREPTCPNKICLQCGRLSAKYSNGCWECQHVPHPLCTKCVWKHDPAAPCMDMRRNPLSRSAPDLRDTARSAPDLHAGLERKRGRSVGSSFKRAVDGSFKRAVDGPYGRQRGWRPNTPPPPHRYTGFRRPGFRRSRP